MGRLTRRVAVPVAGALLLLIAATTGVASSVFGGGGAGDSCLGTVTAPGATPAGLSAGQARNGRAKSRRSCEAAEADRDQLNKFCGPLAVGRGPRAL